MIKSKRFGSSKQSHGEASIRSKASEGSQRLKQSAAFAQPQAPPVVDNLPPNVQNVISRIVEKRVNERLDQEMAKFRDHLEFQLDQQRQGNHHMISQKLQQDGKQGRDTLGAGYGSAAEGPQSRFNEPGFLTS